MTRSRLTKAEFSALLSKEEVWGVACSIKNIQSGFRKCGIYPVDRSQYPQHRFSVTSLRKYNEWVADGKRELSPEELQLLDAENTDTTLSKPDKDDSATSISLEEHNISANDKHVEYKGRTGTIISYFVPDDNPGEIMRMSSSGSSSRQSTLSTSTPTRSDAQKSFQELCLERLDQKAESSSQTTVGKRRKVNPYSEIVTGDEQFAKVIKDAEEKAEKERKKAEKKQHNAEKKEKKAEKKKKLSFKGNAFMKAMASNVSTDSSDDEAIEDAFDDDNRSYGSCEEASHDEDEVVKAGYMFPPASERQAYLYLRDIWEKINPPVIEKDLCGMWFGAIYGVKVLT